MHATTHCVCTLSVRPAQGFMESMLQREQEGPARLLIKYLVRLATLLP